MDGYVTIGTELDTKSFDKQIKEIEFQLKQIDYELSHAKELKLDDRTISEYETKAEKLNNQLIVLKERQNDLNKQDFSNISKGLSNIIKKVSKWALAVFGIRSAYMAVRNAINVISQDDAQLKADIDYIKNAFAYALEPVVRKIVDLARQLLLVIQGIVYAITGKNIFENTNKSLQNSVGSAKELKKTLAGFDEMNVLQDTSGGSSGGSQTPSFDLSDISMAERAIEKLKSKWEQLGEEMRKNLHETDFSIWTDSFGEWDLAVFGVIQQVYGLWRVMSGLGEAVKGIVEMIVGIIEGDTEKIKEGFKDFIKGIYESILGIVEFIKGFENTVKGIIRGLIQTLLGWLFDFINKGVEKFNQFGDKVANVWAGIRDKIKNVIQTIQNWLTEKFGVMGTVIGNAIGGAFKGVVNAVLTAIENILNTPIRAINGLISAINEIPGINLGTLSTFKLPRLAKGGIVNMPGKGVPVGSAIAGEAGREAVLPLQDTQVLQEIADAIGSRITINANITNTMNGRVISRELQRVQNDSDFAFNR